VPSSPLLIKSAVLGLDEPDHLAGDTNPALYLKPYKANCEVKYWVKDLLVSVVEVDRYGV
jgi:hypothetical protein